MELLVLYETPMQPWYALYVKPHKEKPVETLLAQRHFEAFSPFISERRIWSDRIKTVERTLFPGYVFCRFDPYGADRSRVLTAPHVQWIVGNGRDAIPVADAEVEALRLAIASGGRMEPHEYIQDGDWVEVMAGPLAGVRGVLSGRVQRHATVHLVLSIELLRRSVSVEVPRDQVRAVVDRRWAAVAGELGRAARVMAKQAGAFS